MRLVNISDDLIVNTEFILAIERVSTEHRSGSTIYFRNGAKYTSDLFVHGATPTEIRKKIEKQLEDKS